MLWDMTIIKQNVAVYIKYNYRMIKYRRVSTSIYILIDTQALPTEYPGLLLKCN